MLIPPLHEANRASKAHQGNQEYKMAGKILLNNNNEACNKMLTYWD